MIELKSVYRRGAEDGIPFGIFMSLMSLAFIYSKDSTAIAVIAFVMLLSIPGILYVLLRRCYVKECATSSFSSLWMLGILIVLFGSLICGAVTFVWLQYVLPTFIYDQVREAVNLYQQIPEFKDSEVVVALNAAIAEKSLPTPIDFVLQMIMFTTFFGSLISLFLSGMVRMWKVKN